MSFNPRAASFDDMSVYRVTKSLFWTRACWALHFVQY